jgi:hypothetical protein
MSDTSSPLTVDENNLPGKENDERGQQNDNVKATLESSKENSLDGESVKVVNNEGDDSNHAPSVAR